MRRAPRQQVQVTALHPRATVTLRAHPTSPARVEIVYNPTPGRLLRAALWLLGCWGAIPLLLWVPPHYPWVITAFLAGIYLSQRSWRGRYTIQSFAGICPRCGSPLALGVDHVVDLPHTLTCFSCHFEPRLEVQLVEVDAGTGPSLAHHDPDCTGRWTTRWLADEPFVFCELCFAGAPATDGSGRAAAENVMGDLMDQLADEGWPLI